MSQERMLLFSMELSNSKWKLCFGDGSKIRKRNVNAGATERLLEEISKAKKKLGLAEDCRTIGCYEAGRDGFWIHRFLEKNGVENRVVDSGSIERSRRGKNAKTDRIDAEKLQTLLIRLELHGEKRALRVVRVPSEEEEAALRLHREREVLKREINAHRNRMLSLLVAHGIREIDPLKCCFERLQDWEGKALSPQLVEQLKREQQRLALAEEQLKAIESEQRRRIKNPSTKAEKQAKELSTLRGIGVQGSWTLCHEFFGWRNFKNRKEVGGCAGITGTPYDSGDIRREQGISKAGNRRVRYCMIELAWGWLRYQPQSELSQWYARRFAQGGKRLRRIGIVALARKLLVALWKLLEFGEIPEGAQFGGEIR